MPLRRPTKRARLVVRERPLPLRGVLPLLRWLAVVTLMVSLVAGGVRFLTNPFAAGALEFTAHTVAAKTTAIGVLGLALHDLDDDGDLDIVSAGSDGLKLYENKGAYSFEMKIIDDIDGERVQVADLNEDGSPDLLVTARNSANIVRWYANTGTLEYSGTTILSTGTKPLAYAADLNADGALDIVTARTAHENVVLSRWMNNGSGTFTETQLNTDSKVTALTAADIDGNGYANIVTGGADGLQYWRTTDGLTFARVDIDDANPNRSHVAVADSGDGRTLIVTGDTTTNAVAVYRPANGTWQRLPLELDTDAATVVPVDFEGDGDLDVLVAAQDDNSVYWYENTGTDTFTRRTLATGLQSVFGLAAGDLDEDGDIDFVTADHFQGAVYAYERVRVKPVATAPGSIAQSSNGSGVVTFKSTFSDGDRDATRARIQYSLDGSAWHKPWLTKVTADAGTVDLKNSNGYQVGTSNAIDTDANSEVTLTFTWDTKSTQNTGGALTGDHGAVRLRIIPRDAKAVGDAAVSSTFRVDNQVPQGVGPVTVTGTAADSVSLSWQVPTDSSLKTYRVYYGTDVNAVLEQRSADWNSDDDPNLGDTEGSATTVNGLTNNTTYTFKLVVTDAFGNSGSAASVRGTTSSTSTVPASPAASLSPSPTVSPSSPAPPSPSPTFVPSPSPSLEPSPVPTPTPISTLGDNHAPLADAGPDAVVNPLALVVLDATASTDPDLDALSFSWRQIDGPRVQLVSERTATPSFSAGAEHETYIFAVTVRDDRGASAIDTVTVATKALPESVQTPVQVGTVEPTTVPAPPPTQVTPPIVSRLLHPANLVFFMLSLISTVLLLIDRLLNRAPRRSATTSATSLVGADASGQQSRVVHYKTGAPVSNAQVLVYGSDGKLRATERTNAQGVFSAFFPPGQYTLGVQAKGFTFAATAPRTLAPAGGILYTGGTLTVREANQPLAIVIPLKPTAAEVTPLRIRVLHFWQVTQHLGRILSWPIFLGGALLNTALVFIAPRPLYLILEVAYIVLVVLKIALEVRIRPAYGQVRDAITHVPLDLAVVRLFEQKTSRLIMTRVTNNQGKFFALPPAGQYTVTISKPGYASFSKSDVEIKSEHDATLQLTADLMPVIPPTAGGGSALAAARAAAL